MTPTQRDGRHLAMLRDRLGEQFCLGLVVPAGDHTLPLGERIWAVPSVPCGAATEAAGSSGSLPTPEAPRPAPAAAPG